MPIPVFDFDRDKAGRTVLDQSLTEPYIDETDSYCAMPIRLVHRTDSGLVIECGPYTFDESDVDHLRTVIRTYDIATTGPKMRRIK